MKMNVFLPFVLIIMTVPLLLGGCKDKPIAGYVPASSFSKKGFAKNREEVLALRTMWVSLLAFTIINKE